MKKELPAWAKLVIIALVSGLLLSVTNELTKDAIVSRAEQAAIQAYRAVLPEAETLKTVDIPVDAGLDACYQGIRGGETIGYAAQATVRGYSGEIEVIVGVDAAGAVTGIGVGGLDFAETPGLGSRVQEPLFLDQFVNASAPFALGETIDAVAGATVSSSAVVQAVNSASAYMRGQLGLLTDGISGAAS